MSKTTLRSRRQLRTKHSLLSHSGQPPVRRPAKHARCSANGKLKEMPPVSLAPLYRKNAIDACRLALNATDPVESNGFADIAERWVVLAETEEARPSLH